MEFPPYRKAEMVKIVRRYHPAYANSGTDALAELSRAAGGNFRDWAKLLRAALKLGVDPDNGFTVQQARTVIRAVDGRTTSGPKDRASRKDAA